MTLGRNRFCMVCFTREPNALQLRSLPVRCASLQIAYDDMPLARQFKFPFRLFNDAAAGSNQTFRGLHRVLLRRVALSRALRHQTFRRFCGVLSGFIECCQRVRLLHGCILYTEELALRQLGASNRAFWRSKLAVTWTTGAHQLKSCPLRFGDPLDFGV